MDPIWWILIISVAGPILGSAIGVLAPSSKLLMYNMLSFAAGVMIAISFLELIPHAINVSSVMIAVLGIVLGSAVMYLLDRILPHIHPGLCTQEQGCHLKKTAIYLLVGIFIHNFPEGMAIAAGIVEGTKLSMMIAIAIAVQNVPEGICTSAPYYACTKKKLKSFLVSSSTAIPILAGFLITKFIFEQISPALMGMLVAATAGVMIYISADELIPTSCSINSNHSTIFSFMIGILFVVMLGLI
ncbi:ZIP family metal transporter [Candidatus Woesearchaeota archaeon]|nr:ZIP family metal transporter [Candidatus Woesearchaeota archaeon]